MIKIREEMNETENRKTMEKINKTKSWFFDQITKIDKSWLDWIRNKEKMTQITKLEMKREELLTLWNKKDKKYYEQLHTLGNLDEMDKFLERCKLLKMT